jgi:hypothetical protein
MKLVPPWSSDWEVPLGMLHFSMLLILWASASGTLCTIYNNTIWRTSPCSLSAVDRNHAVGGPRVGNGLSNALNVIATKPSPVTKVESRRCNPMMQNPVSRIQNQRPGYYNYRKTFAKVYSPFQPNQASVGPTREKCRVVHVVGYLHFVTHCK